jgi:hypothetical protein
MKIKNLSDPFPARLWYSKVSKSRVRLKRRLEAVFDGYFLPVISRT